MEKNLKSLFIIFLACMSLNAFSQEGFSGGFDIEDDDLSVGSDIFSDFNEDIESNQVLEDERYYRFGRFFSLNLTLGLTGFTGNRGSVYENEHPTFGLSLSYFMNFRSAMTMGFAFSKHTMFVGEATNLFPQPPGLIEINMLRVFFGYRYYIETADLGTAITYSNPYFTGRLEYWYQTNKFIDQSLKGDESGGGLGFGLGGGLEFPIVLKESYINLEFLYHTVNFFDKFTSAFAEDASSGAPGLVDDLTGAAFTTTVSYVINW